MVDFNPYREWLGVETTSERPNYYELLGLPPFEGDSDRIVHAADQQLNLVRKVRPGPHIDQWQRMLDELIEIRRLLTDFEKKRQYDDQLRRQQGLGGGLSAAIVPANPTKQDSDVQVSPVRNLLPPTAEELAREAANNAAKPSPAASNASSLPLSAAQGSPANPVGSTFPQLATGWQGAQSPPAAAPQSAPGGYGNIPYGTGYGPVIPASYGQGAGGPPASAFPAPPGMVGGPFAQHQPQYAPPAAPTQPPQYGQAPAYGQPPQFGQATPFGQPQPGYGTPGQVPYGQSQPVAFAPGQPAYGAMPGVQPGQANNPYTGGSYLASQPPFGQSAQQAPWGGSSAAPNALAGGWGAGVPGTQGMYAPPGGLPASTTPMALPVGRNVPAGNPMAPVGSAAVGASPFDSSARRGIAATMESAEQAPTIAATPASASTMLAGRRRSSQSTMIASALAAVVGLAVLFVVLQMMKKEDAATAKPEGGNGVDAKEPTDTQQNTPNVVTPPVSPQPINTNVPPVAPNPPRKDETKPGKMDANPNGDKAPAVGPNGNATRPKSDGQNTQPMPVNPDTAKPMPEPKPVQPQPVKPADIPNPTQVAPTTPEAAVAEMTKSLAAAKAALIARNAADAKVQLTVAASMAKAPDHVAMVKRLEALTHFVGEFWKGVADGMKQLDGVDELVVRDLRVRVVEFSDGQITVRAGGKNLRYTTDDVPSGLAEVLFERVRDMKDPLNKMSKGAFHATDKNRSVDDARRIFQEAQLVGGDVEELLAVLDDKYDVKNPPVARVVPKKQHLPDPSAMSEATTKIKGMYGKEIAAARTAQQKYDMAKRLMEEAAMPLENEALRLAIFNEARDLAANAHLAQLTVQIIDETEKWFEIDVLATKFDALSKAAAKASPQASRDIALECLQLTDQAEEAKRLDLADKFVRIAGGAARASRDPALAKRATDRAKDIQKVFKEGAKDGAKDAAKEGAKDAAKEGPAKPPTPGANKPANEKPANEAAAAAAAGPNAAATK